jgi:hypothetical protein
MKMLVDILFLLFKTILMLDNLHKIVVDGVTSFSRARSQDHKVSDKKASKIRGLQSIELGGNCP